MTASAAGGPLLGREAELQVVAALVGGIATGVGGALVVSGEAGIGKSRLLAAAAGLAADSGVQVLSATGIQAGARFAFAGLHQLLRPVLPLADRLPPRQRDALHSAFGLADQESAGLFLIGLAALELISEAAASSPMLLIADDAQWLDEQSCAVLGFVARRLAAERAALLVAVRDGQPGPFDDAGLPGLRLTGLPESAAAALLNAQAPDLDPALRDRLLAEAAGNPLALVELPKAVRPGQSACGQMLWPLLPLTARLERAFAVQESGLPAVTRSVLLVAAAADDSALHEVLAAASVLTGTEVTTDALTPATQAGLVEIDEAGIAFRHPLIRSAVYQAARPSRRRAAHAALAGALDGYPDRRAWHQGAAATGPDEQAAADLEAAADRAERRGALTLAVDAYRRAAQLSEDVPGRGRRLQRAAAMAFSAGRHELGEELLHAIESLDLTAEQRAWVTYKRETFAGGAWSAATMVDSFVRLSETMRAAGQTAAALEVLLSIALRCYWGNPGEQTRAAVLAAAEKLPLPGADPGLLLILASADPLRRGALVNAETQRISPDDRDPAGMYYVGLAATEVWSWDRSLPLLEAGVNGLRRQGRVGLLVQALVTQAWAALHASRLPAALSAADEAARLAPETAQANWTYPVRPIQALAAAARGDTADADALIQEAEEGYLTMGGGPPLSLVQFTRGRSAMLNQQYAEGLAHLRRVLDPGDPAYHPYVGAWGLADLTEASVHAGDLPAAQAYLTQAESLAAQTSGTLPRAMAAYARPLVAADEDAEPLYQAALAEGLASWPDYRARMLLHYGQWLRRQRQEAASRAPLREARDSFDALGFASLAERARVELRAAGEASSRRAPRPLDQLTAQELQIARMAADGMSNREIGQQLYLSHRTVGAHLYRIFPKLGVTSRSQLHAALR